MSRNLAVNILFLAIYLAFLAYLCRRAWGRFAHAAPGKNFNYHLTDMFAATLGLLPTVWTAASYARDEQPPLGLLGLIMLGTAQLAGMFMGRLFVEWTSTVHPHSGDRALSAIVIIFCALCAIPFVVLYLAGFSTGLPAAVIYILLYRRRSLSTPAVGSQIS